MIRKLLGAVVMVLLAAAAGLPLSGVAYADGPADAEPGEVVGGECAATVLEGRGKPLTVDADAALLDGGLPAVRLGTSTDRIAEEPAVDLPVGDVVEGLDVQDAPVVGEAAQAACGAADSTGGAVNEVAKTTHAVAAPVQAVEPQPEPEPEEPVEEVQPPEEPAGDGEVVDEVPVLPESALQSSPLTATPALASLPLGPLPKIDAPLPEAAAPESGLRLGGRDDSPATANAGQVTALPQPAADEPPRAPFVLAVGLLAVVAGVLLRRWVTRKPSAS